MILASHRVGSPDAPHLIVFLHGIYGSGTNLRTLARSLVESFTDFQGLLLDLRNHGASLPAPEPHTLVACAQDLADTFAALNLSPTALCGHSFGGKVALTYAASFADSTGSRLRSVHVLDSPPGPSAAAPTTAQVRHVLSVIEQLPQPAQSRDAAVSQLENFGLSPMVARWLATNLTSTPDGLRWRFFVPGLRAMLEDFWVVDQWPTVFSAPVLIHLVRAEKSLVWTEEDLTKLAQAATRPNVRVDVLPKSDHWVHIDNPKGLFQLLTAVLRDIL